MRRGPRSLVGDYSKRMLVAYVHNRAARANS